MDQTFKISLLALFLCLIGWSHALAQFTYGGSTSGILTWTDPAGNTIPLEDIGVELIVVGQGSVDRTFTGPGGNFTFVVPSFTTGSPTEEMRLRVWSINRDTTIQARNLSNTGVRKRTLFTNGQLVWTGNTPPPAIGTAVVPTSGRAQCVHWANKAKNYVEAEMGTDFQFPNALPKTLHIMNSPLDIEQNFFLPGGLHTSVIAMMATFPNIVFAIPGLNLVLQTAPGSLPSIFSNNPAVYISDDENSGTTYHEFGHFLMWNLQGEAWLSLQDAGLSHHSSLANDPTQKMAWTEGFANGFARIMRATDRNLTGVNPATLDLTGTIHTGTDTFQDASNNVLIGQVLDHGFAAESYIGRYFYDLWDGPNNLALFGNSTPFASRYNDSGVDATELSLRDILTPILFSSANLPAATPVLDRFGQEEFLINNINEYHASLGPAGFCLLGQNIPTLTKLNFLHNLATPFNDPIADIEYMNSDAIFYERTVGTRRFRAVNNPAYNFRELNPTTDEVFHRLDVTHLVDGDDDYNVIRKTPSPASEALSDSMVIGMDPANPPTLHFGRNLRERFQSPVNTYSSPISPIFPVAGGEMSALTMCGLAYDVGDNGTVELGDSTDGNTARVTFSSGSTFILGGAPGSGRGPGKLVINNGSRLIIDSDANFIFNPGSEIHLNGKDAVLEINGNWTIADGATFTFTGAGHIETRLPDPTFAPFGNITMGLNSSIELEGSGKEEQVIWVVKNGSDVLLPSNRTDLDLSLEKGTIVMEDKTEMRAELARVRLNSAVFTAPDPFIERHGGFHCLGRINLIKRTDFRYGSVGLGIDMTSVFSFQNAEMTYCNFKECGTGHQQIGKTFTLDTCTFTGNAIGVEASDMFGQSNVLGNLFSGGGISYACSTGTSSNNLFVSSTGMGSGATAILLNGDVKLMAECLTILNYQTAVELKNLASASMVGQKKSSFSTSDATWKFNGGQIPGLYQGNSQFISSSGILFEGAALPTTPASLGWDFNHWQGNNGQILLPSHQNMTDFNTGLPLVKSGLGLSLFEPCGGSNKAAAIADLESEIASEWTVRPYPQPFSESLSLEVEGLGQDLDLAYRLHDLSGRVVAEGLLAPGQRIIRGLSSLPAGVYLLQLEAAGRSFRLKVHKS